MRVSAGMPGAMARAEEDRHLVQAREVVGSIDHRGVDLVAVDVEGRTVDPLQVGLGRRNQQGAVTGAHFTADPDTGIPHAERVDARIAGRLQCQIAAAGHAHHRNGIGLDLAGQRRAATRRLRLGPIERRDEVGGCDARLRLARHGRRPNGEEAVRGDGRQITGKVMAVRQARAISPDHDGQRVTGRKSREIRGSVNLQWVRARNGFRRHGVRPNHCARRALFRQSDAQLLELERQFGLRGGRAGTPQQQCREDTRWAAQWGTPIGRYSLVNMHHRPLLMVGPDVLAQQVAAEIILEIAPDGMHVVAIVLRVVELDEEGRPLHAVVVLLAALDTACPGE